MSLICCSQHHKYDRIKNCFWWIMDIFDSFNKNLSFLLYSKWNFEILLHYFNIDGQLTSLVLNSKSFFNLFSRRSRCTSDSEGNSNCLSSSMLIFPILTTWRVFDGVESKWLIFTSILIRWFSIASVFFNKSFNNSTQLDFPSSNAPSCVVVVVEVEVKLELDVIFSKKLL